MTKQNSAPISSFVILAGGLPERWLRNLEQMETATKVARSNKIDTKIKEKRGVFTKLRLKPKNASLFFVWLFCTFGATRIANIKLSTRISAFFKRAKRLWLGHREKWIVILYVYGGG